MLSYIFYDSNERVQTTQVHREREREKDYFDEVIIIIFKLSKLVWIVNVGYHYFQHQKLTCTCLFSYLYDSTCTWEKNERGK